MVLWIVSTTRQDAPETMISQEMMNYALKAEIRVPEEDSEKEMLDLRTYAQVRAIEEGVNPNKFFNLIDCESNWKEDAKGDGGKAFGILQFWKNTFDTFSHLYKMNGDYYNNRDQINLALRMIRKGHASHWQNCARISGLLS